MSVCTCVFKNFDVSPSVYISLSQSPRNEKINYKKLYTQATNGKKCIQNSKKKNEKFSTEINENKGEKKTKKTVLYCIVSND